MIFPSTHEVRTNSRMKKLGCTILVITIALLAIADIVHDFVVNDPVRYFSERPHQLFLVAVIGIAGGLIVFGFLALPPRLQRKIKLVLLGSGGSFITLVGGYFSFSIFQTSGVLAQFSSFFRYLPWFLLLGTAILAGWLWFAFCQVLKSRPD